MASLSIRDRRGRMLRVTKWSAAHRHSAKQVLIEALDALGDPAYERCLVTDNDITIALQRVVTPAELGTARARVLHVQADRSCGRSPGGSVGARTTTQLSLFSAQKRSAKPHSPWCALVGGPCFDPADYEPDDPLLPACVADGGAECRVLALRFETEADTICEWCIGWPEECQCGPLCETCDRPEHTCVCNSMVDPELGF